MSFIKNLRTAAIAATLAISGLQAAQADEQFFPLQSYRVGPYAAGGTGFFGGFIDYLNLVNIRDGGVGGVKLTWEEGETQYEVERGVEVYERLKTHPGIAAWNPLSVGIAYALIDRVTADKVPLLTVEENLLTGGLGRSASRAELAQDLERVYAIFPHLRDKRRAQAGLTSGGEQQMTAIGRALMSRPRLLVLDEPSMGLAPLVVQDIFRQLKRLNQDEGLTILVAEQNSTVALQYADRATVLDTGVAVLTGTTAELRQRSDIQSFYFGEAIAEELAG